MNRLREEAESAEWATTLSEIEPRHATDDTFFELMLKLTGDVEKRMSAAAKLREFATDALEMIRRAITVKFEGFEWSMAGDLDAGTRSTAELLLGATKASVAAGKRGLVVLFDEAQILADRAGSGGNHVLSSLVAAVSLLQRQEIPVVLALCGLPNLAVNLLSARTYSERMFVGFKVDSLLDHEASDAFTRPLIGSGLRAERDLVSRVVTEVEGYPYFIQLWGAELWDAAADAGQTVIGLHTLDLTRERIIDRLDLDFYAPRVDSLTPAEQDLLLASAACGYPPLRVSELNAASDKSNENINVLLGRLVKSNALYRGRKGEYFYAAPQFRDYLRRRMAEDDAGAFF